MKQDTAPPPLSPGVPPESGSMAAVMRAMTGSMSGLSMTRSRSEVPSEGSTSPPARGVLDDNHLVRTTSRLVPPGSTVPSSGGILIK